MSRNVLRIGVIFAVLFLLIGCETKQTEVQTEQTKREPLVLWSYFETQAQRQGMDKLLRDFNQSQNRYQASWEYIPMTSFTKSLSSAFTENTLPDMAILDNPDMPVLIQLGMFEDITEQAAQWNLGEEFYPAIVETAMYQGRCYGIPFNCNNTALIYNEALFGEAGLMPPATWEEMQSTAKALTTPERAGFLMCGIEGEQGAFQILPWILAAGEDPQNLGTERTEKAFAFLQEMLKDGSLSENCINLTQTDVAKEFAEGKAAMMQNGPWVFPMLEEAGIAYGVVRIPMPAEAEDNQGCAVVGGENIGIIRGKNVDGALAFIRFCMDTGALLDFCQRANVLPGKIEAAHEMVKTRQTMQVFEEQMHTAVTRTSIPGWASVSQKLTDGMFELVSQGKTPAQIAKEMAKN